MRRKEGWLVKTAGYSRRATGPLAYPKVFPTACSDNKLALVPFHQNISCSGYGLRPYCRRYGGAAFCGLAGEPAKRWHLAISAACLLPLGSGRPLAGPGSLQRPAGTHGVPATASGRPASRAAFSAMADRSTISTGTPAPRKASPSATVQLDAPTISSPPRLPDASPSARAIGASESPCPDNVLASDYPSTLLHDLGYVS